MKHKLIRHIGAWPKKPKNNINRHHFSFLQTKNKAGDINVSSDNSSEALFSGEFSDGPQRASLEIPKGFMAVYVGPELRRFVIPMRCLSSSGFRVLLKRVEEEYGYKQEGVFRIPCDVEDFEHILVRCLSNIKKNDKKIRK